MSLYIVPYTIRQANAYVAQLHRHNNPVTGTRLVFAAADSTGKIRGVALVGRPVSRHLDDGWTLEINRLCTDGYVNASLRAVGWKYELREIGHQWNCESRPRKEETIYLSDKYRWEVALDTELPFGALLMPEHEETQPVLWEVSA